MPRFFIVLTFFSVLFVACRQTEPERIFWGKDSCNHCKMVLTDKRFGAEIVTAKGKVYKFDSIECMHGFEKSEAAKLGEDYSRFLVDTTNNGELIPADKAFITHDPHLHSPMGKGLLVSGSESALKTFAGSQAPGPIEPWSAFKQSLDK